ncbi:hypothetical protein NONI108955_22575 [Nocardia ninae]|uniref:Cysteine dioxygenase n=1 Tax=Nocardia ninae NBRC 108245 TaxID=1210091 RepID=A0A511MEF0_9NOCA|nr:hypothetical protein [Nocardia ninae]GEM38517.1 hypothetical protein NN4_30360 [Nocardia ninae NBRC 108245]
MISGKPEKSPNAPFDLGAACSAVEWEDPRRACRQARTILGRLVSDRALFSETVFGIEADPARLARSESHPLLHRLSLYEDPQRRCQLRLHVFSGRERDLVPHDHKYPFSVYVVAGGYLHVWNRRVGESQSGEFLSTDISPGIVSVERPGSCYTFQNSLVHQTIVMPGTVSLFLRGPKRQDRWHAAGDMLHLLEGYEAPRSDRAEHQGAQPMTLEDLHRIRRGLVRSGIIADQRSSHVIA